MSSNLRAEPINRKKLDLGTSIKFALRKVYGEPVNIILNDTAIPVLKGMMAVGDDNLVKDAEKLIKFIETYKDVSLREEY
jgi:hypothetical protein